MSDERLNSTYRIITWILLGVVLIIPFVAWAESMSWRFTHLSAIILFPLLGLWAWSIMWTHYALGSIRLVESRVKEVKVYSLLTRVLVLLLIVLHPGLLIWTQWEALGTWPPGSVYSYVGSSMKIYATLGAIALMFFVSFEFLERLRNHPTLRRNWFWVSVSQMLAMTLILIHSFALGGTISGWFAFYWFTLGALLIPCFGLIGRADWGLSKSTQ